MKAFKIDDIKDFMNQLLLGETFDRFFLVEASVTTYCTFTIDGTLHEDFFDTDERNLLTQNQVTLATWKEIRPHCFAIIRGKRTPLSFKIVFQLPPRQMRHLLDRHGISISPELVKGLFLNLQYKNKELLCITGTSLSTFLPDKSLEQLWDNLLPDFFRQHNILFEEL
jgi:hypothetical protein